MAKDESPSESAKPPPASNIQGNGQSAGVRAEARQEKHSYNPQGVPGVEHWEQSFITKPGLGERGNVFFAAIEMTRMPMLMTDPSQPDNPIVFANRAFVDLTGYREDEVLGRNCRFLQGPGTDPATVDELRHAVAQAKPVAVEILNYKKDGRPFWNALFVGPVFDTNGKHLYWFASQIDVTERRSLQQSLHQAQKLEAIGQLSAGMAHDFNNLLHVVIGNIELAKRLGAGDARLQTALGRAEKAAFKGGKLTQQLLTFARKQRLEPREVNLNALIVDFSDMLVRTLGEHIDLRLDLKPGLPNCVIDPVHLEMALLNVLINARDAMPNGGQVAVTTTLGGAQHDGSLSIVLSVRDEGHGMPPDVLARAAEPFYTTKDLGTGLGLAMVHGFVEQSQGKLDITSEPGKGTTVRLAFPAAHKARMPSRDGAQVPIEQAGHAAAEEAAEAPAVLVVEDCDDVRELAEACLVEKGWDVLSVPSGEAALQVVDAQRRSIDVLVTDIMMPGSIDGLKLAEQVRLRVPKVQVVLMTGYTDRVPQVQEAGAYKVLTKPFHGEELQQAVTEVVAQRNRSSAAW